MPVLPGQRYVARQSAPRLAVDNTVAAPFDFDTEVIVEGDYERIGTEVRVDSAGQYLVIHGTGEVTSTTVRATGTNSITVNGVSQGIRGLTTNRYVRASGDASRGVSLGAAILDLDEGDLVGSQVDGSTFAGALGEFDVGADQGGALQLIRLPEDLYLDVELGEPLAPVPISFSEADGIRPWSDSTPVMTPIPFGTPTSDTGGWFAGNDTAPADEIVLDGNSKYLIVWSVQFANPLDTVNRQGGFARVVIDGTPVQHGSAYRRDEFTDGAVTGGVYLHDNASGSTDTLQLQATMEMQPAAGTAQVTAAALQVLRLPNAAEWMHVDRGATAQGGASLNSTNFRTLEQTSEFRPIGNDSMEFRAVFQQIRNATPSPLPVLGLAWQNWDRDLDDTRRKVPTCRFFLDKEPITQTGGTPVPYGWGGAYSRGDTDDIDVHHAALAAAATFDLTAQGAPNENGAVVEVRDADAAPGDNSNMIIAGNNNRLYQGFVLLDLTTIIDPGIRVVEGGRANDRANPIIPAPSGVGVAPIGTAIDTTAIGDIDAERTTFTATNSTSGSVELTPTEVHNVDLSELGTIAAGDGLIVAFGIDGNSALFIPSDFEILLDAQAPDGQARALLAYKVAAGFEGPVLQFGTNQPTTSVHRAWRFDADTIFDWNESPPVGIVQGGTNLLPNSPRLDVPWPPLLQTWWLTGYVADDAASVADIFPAFVSALFTQAGGNEAMATAERFDRLLGTFDPGPFAFASDAAEQWTAWTVAVRPADTGESPLGPITTAPEDNQSRTVDPIVSSAAAPVATSPEDDTAEGIASTATGRSRRLFGVGKERSAAGRIVRAGTGSSTSVAIGTALGFDAARVVSTAIDLPRDLDVDHDVFFLDRHLALVPITPDDIGRREGETELVASILRTLDSSTIEKRAVDIITPGDPSATPPEFAITTNANREPDVFLPGEYVGKWDQNTGRIRALSPLFGEGQVLNATAGRTYFVWVRWTLGIERPVRVYETIKVV